MQQHGHGTPSHKLKQSEMMDSQENTTPKGIEEEQKAEAAAPVTNVDNENDVKEDAKADTQEQAAAVEPDAQDTAA